MRPQSVIGVSMNEPHTGNLAGGFSICIYIHVYVWYVRDSVYLYDLFKQRPAPGLGTRSTATRPGYSQGIALKGCRTTCVKYLQ